LQKHGFVDTFRQVHSQPEKQYGITWSPGYPKGRVDENEVHDRIDFIYAKSSSNLQLKAFHAYTIDEAPNDLPYPSDHRAVVTRVALLPTNDVNQKSSYPYSL
jgi:exonuclease III